MRQSSGVDLAEIIVRPYDVSETSARLVVEVTLRNWTAVDQPTTVDGTIRPSNFPAGGAPALPLHLAVTARPGTTHALRGGDDRPPSSLVDVGPRPFGPL